jgi:hypothetical protein
MIVKGGHRQQDGKTYQEPVNLFHKNLRTTGIFNGVGGAVKIHDAYYSYQNQQEQ